MPGRSIVTGYVMSASSAMGLAIADVLLQQQHGELQDCLPNRTYACSPLNLECSLCCTEVLMHMEGYLLVLLEMRALAIQILMELYRNSCRLRRNDTTLLLTLLKISDSR